MRTTVRTTGWILLAALLLLLTAEVLRVYWIMPFPGSQRGQTLVSRLRAPPRHLGDPHRRRRRRPLGRGTGPRARRPGGADRDPARAGRPGRRHLSSERPDVGRCHVPAAFGADLRSGLGAARRRFAGSAALRPGCWHRARRFRRCQPRARLSDPLYRLSPPGARRRRRAAGDGHLLHGLSHRQGLSPGRRRQGGELPPGRHGPLERAVRGRDDRQLVAPGDGRSGHRPEQGQEPRGDPLAPDDLGRLDRAASRDRRHEPRSGVRRPLRADGGLRRRHEREHAHRPRSARAGARSRGWWGSSPVAVRAPSTGTSSSASA